jgi:hypothetical protein
VSRYQISRVRRASAEGSPHRHAVVVETVSGEILSIEEVNARMNAGHEFFTRGPSTGQTATVEAFACCGLDTLRSASGATQDNDLGSLPPC